jgi:hypothetical protein
MNANTTLSNSSSNSSSDRALYSLIEIIIQDDNLIFERKEDLLKYDKKTIINLIITNDYIEQIPKLKKIYSNEVQTINMIIDSLILIVNEIDLETYKWIITNEQEIFINFTNKLNINNFIGIIESDNFIQICDFIKEKNIFNVFSNQIVNFINNYIGDSSYINYRTLHNYQFFKTFEKIILLTDTYLNSVKKLYNYNIHCKIINLLLKVKTPLEIIIQYKKHYKISDNDLKNWFEKNVVLENFIKYSSTGMVGWFFEIASIFAVIKSSNYKNIFNNACASGNLELIKLIYNLIQCAGYNINKNDLYGIMNRLIYEERWENKIHYDDIIYEFINMGCKPPSLATKYYEYYKNITIIEKK